jgi:hypothetical protein
LTSTATENVTQVKRFQLQQTSVVLEGGILRVGPITNATIASMFFDGSSHFYRLGPRPGSDTILLKGRANGTTIAGFTIVDETTFEVKMRTFSLDVNSFVVPLQDMSNDDRELDDHSSEDTTTSPSQEPAWST